MAGRPSKPVGLILMEGNKDHRTKEQLETRKAAEQALYTGFTFHESKQVRDNPEAHKVFAWLRRLYKKITYIDGLDEQTINRYCLEVANTCGLQHNLQRLNDSLAECADVAEKLKIFELISDTLRAMNKNKELLLKYEDRLFLNPASRIRSIPKSPPKEQATGGIAAFMKKRSEAQ